MGRTILLAVALAILWLLLSGYLKTPLLAFGVVSVAFSIFVAYRMRIVDEETVPSQVPLRIFTYWGWLGRQIFWANLAVAKVILARRMPIQQQFLSVDAPQKSPVGKVIYANSITLTPGTVTVETFPGHFLVHAINDDAADLGALKEMSDYCIDVENRVS